MNIIKKNKILVTFLVDFILITGSFFMAVFSKRGSFKLTNEYLYLQFTFYFIWFISAITVNKFRLIRPKKLMEGLSPLYRAFFYMTAILFFLIFLFKLFNYSRFIILATLLIYFCILTLGYSIFYIFSGELNVYEVDENTHAILEKEEIAGIDTKSRSVKENLRSKLKDEIFKENPKLFNLIDSSINLEAIKASNSIALNSMSYHTVESIMNNKIEFLCNLQLTNNIKRINRFFIAVNHKLVKGGYFIGLMESLEARKKRKFVKYPIFIQAPLIFLDFVYKRIFPKLPILKKIYFMISKGKKRVISKCEVLGRLYYCGFRLVKMKEIDNKFYFVIKKVANPLKIINPSYGLIFKQRRYGKNGEIIYIYKLRTMHPYAEYLRPFVLNNHGYSTSGSGIGKINNDFRVTSWGKFFRKFFLDEFPQLINLLRGEMKLVGVRPLGKTFLAQYPEDFRAKRLKQKPGCIPPYVAHIHNSIEEYIDAEKKYISSLEKHPILTDIKYFFWALYNIITGKIKSK